MHSCIMATPLPENVLMVFSVFTTQSPVLRKTASSHAENHIVRFAQKMNRRILRLASWRRLLFCASGLFSSSSVRLMPEMNGCSTEPKDSCAFDKYFVM